MTNLAHKVTLVLGDWSHDGHSMTESYTIDSSLSTKEVVAAYAVGTTIVGIDVTDTLCSGYENNSISGKDMEQLLKFPKLKKVFRGHGYKKEGGVYPRYTIDRETYAKLFLGVCELGDPKFSYKFAKVPDTINIGGYGLFD